MTDQGALAVVAGGDDAVGKTADTKGNIMRVAITSQGKELSSELDPRFGRAKYFIVIDTDSGEFTAHDNSQNLNAAQGAGIQAGQNVIDLGVEAVITGNVGPKAFRTLQAGNVKIYIAATGPVANVIEQLKVGKLQEAKQANVEGHWV
jgi:predicted Fe-Mo cluster-binding NifX family protein